MSHNSKYRFEKLTPISNSELGIYEDAIDFVFDNDDVRNVAISGAYGAGKSSVLESYKAKHKDKKYVHVSLAHFSENVENDESETVKESVLEGKILNQLIHQISSDRIPQTNFKVKKSITHKETLRASLLALVFVVSAVVFILFSKWSAIVEKVNTVWLRIVLKNTVTAEARLVVGLVMALIGCYYVYRIIQAQQNRHMFRKLSVQGNEIEIFEESDDSYFDKYLNEVLYLFDNVDADVIVFEDMDRFDANRIFERLREVNTLTNLQRKEDGKKVIRFFYLLRDDIFVSKDRTKFFDYIIPVVPVVDGSNSYNQFISHLKKNDLYEKFDEGFLQGLSLYVDDMRLLKNICNEFLIYYNRLNTIELDYNKMMALIVYKNLFPRDFSDLQLNRGFVFALFDQKGNFIKKEQEKYQIEINNLEAKIESAKNEKLHSLEDLNDLGWAKEHKYNWQVKRNWDQNEYPKRKRDIENQNLEVIKKMEQEIEGLQQKILRLDNMSLSQIITRDNIDGIFCLTTTNEIGVVRTYEEIRGSDYFSLLKYLIRNGYIDETYADYMTYFYEDSLSRIDKIFLRSVADKKAGKYTYKLKNPKMVFDRLKVVDFEQEETLNNDLLNYLILNAKGSEELSRLIVQIRNYEKYDFVEQFLESTENKQALISVINEKWPEFFSDVLGGHKMSMHSIRELSISILYYSDDDSIHRVNGEGVLADYISSAKDYLSIENPNTERLVHGFDVLGVFFPSIEYDTANEELFKAVYENGNYEINYNNIRMILTVVFDVQNEDDIRHKTSTLVFSEKECALAKKMKDKITDYLSVVLTECQQRINDGQEIALEILNDASIDLEQKKEYIAYLQTKISDITLVEDRDLWHAMMAADVITSSEKNVMEYYLNGHKLDEAVIKLINNTASALDFSNLDETFDASKKELFNAMIQCAGINNDIYEKTVKSFGFHYKAFSFEGISNEKMHILINHSVVRMNKDTLGFVREKYPESLEYYIRRNIDEYVSIVDNELFSLDELLSILSMDVSNKNKITLLKLTSEPISIKGKNYPISVQEHILLYNRFDDDIPYLYSSYSQQALAIQRIVFSIACQDIESVISDSDNVDRKLVDELMKSADIEINSKKELLLVVFSHLSREDIKAYLVLVEKEEFCRIFDSNTRPRYEDTTENRELLDAFVNRGWLYDYTPENGSLKVRRNPPKKSDANP